MIEINNVKHKIIINYKNIKHIYFKIDDSLNVVVNTNNNVTEKEIISLLNENKTNLQKLINKKERSLTPKLSYLGNELNFIKSDKLKIINNNIYAPNINEANNYIHSLAHSYFIERVNIVKKTFNYLPTFKMKSKVLKSKWGSLSTVTNTIVLNKELIKYREEIIDYVIVHELSHFKHMNHSKDFWNEVERHCPNYKNLRKELRE